MCEPACTPAFPSPAPSSARWAAPATGAAVPQTQPQRRHLIPAARAAPPPLPCPAVGAAALYSMPSAAPSCFLPSVVPLSFPHMLSLSSSLSLSIPTSSRSGTTNRSATPISRSGRLHPTQCDSRRRRDQNKMAMGEGEEAYLAEKRREGTFRVGGCSMGNPELDAGDEEPRARFEARLDMRNGMRRLLEGFFGPNSSNIAIGGLIGKLLELLLALWSVVLYGWSPEPTNLLSL